MQKNIRKEKIPRVISCCLNELIDEQYLKCNDKEFQRGGTVSKMWCCDLFKDSYVFTALLRSHTVHSLCTWVETEWLVQLAYNSFKWQSMRLKLFSYFKSGILNVSMFSNVRTSNNLTFGKGYHACVCGCVCYKPEDTEHLLVLARARYHVNFYYQNINKVALTELKEQYKTDWAVQTSDMLS